MPRYGTDIRYRLRCVCVRQKAYREGLGPGNASSRAITSAPGNEVRSFFALTPVPGKTGKLWPGSSGTAIGLSYNEK